MKIQRLLIANRGEIACRVIRTAQAMGIETVAVYSDADAGAMHVAMAEKAVRIGPALAAESYLDMSAVIGAAQASGADAVHPGYGFLSENADFVEACTAAGLIFVGPSAEAIRAMGLKDAAKALMAEAGVPVVPGYHGAEQAPDFLAARAGEIGYPVLIKAVAGGGGKGMRLVARAEEFALALQSAVREAEGAFGNGAVLIEKFIEAPRHIEIQVFGDGARAVHLFERDCSLQRRHQKVIEEAPAPGMTEDLRAAMGAAAVRAAEAIGYKGAGTVEFIVDGTGPLRADGFWFMEMNTRLQVEHPVTEAVTGVDLVRWQLEVAAGAPLPAAQAEIPLSGHSFEARLYAEDPAKGFLPAIGRLGALRFGAGLRVETGVRAGDEISPYYDPMIAKVIAHGASRAEALARLASGLRGTEVAGCVTNLSFLKRLAEDPGFAGGGVSTGYIAEAGARLTEPREAPAEIVALAALAALGVLGEGADGFALWRPLRWRAPLAGREIWAELLGAGRYRITEGAEMREIAPEPGGAEGWRIGGGGRAFVAVLPSEVVVTQAGEAYHFPLADPLAVGSGADAGGDDVRAPMPGLVKAVHVAAGDEVAAGAPLVVLEAMKMEHVLSAPRAGRIADLPVAEGAQVADGDLMARMEAEDG